MKQLTCEMCGSTDMVKQEGVFVCQTCGTKYTVEEAKRMMVEGTVEVSGTVKIDKTPEITNIIKNADLAFVGGNYTESFNLYSQALNIYPDDPYAIIRKAVSSAYLSSVANCRLPEINTAVQIAFTLKHKQSGNTIEYFNFVTESVNIIAPCINGIANMFITYYKKAKPVNLSITSMILTSGLTQEVSQTLKTGTMNCCIVSENTALCALEDVDDFEEATEGYWSSILTLLSNPITYMSNAHLSDQATKNRLETKSREVTELKAKSLDKKKYIENKKRLEENARIEKERKEKAEKIEAYWAEHSEEKQQLESECEKLLSDKKELESQLIPLNKEINDLKDKRGGEVPSEKEKNTILSEISRLRKEQEQLGLFKGKEKKAIQSQINELNARLLTINEAIELEKKKQLQDCNAKIREVEEKAKPIKDKVTAIQKRIEEINTELTKER